MSTIDIGAVLPTALDELTAPRTPGVAEAAAAVEERGLESLWVTDLVLGDGTPALEPTLALAAAASVTRRVRLGFGVLSVPPRPAPWLASQIATLQHLSANRLLLGAGLGGSPDAPLWRALGVPPKGRGRTTDAILDLLPPLVTGEEVRFEEADTTLRLAPAAPMPPVLLGVGERSFDRILRLGAGWLPSQLSPTDLGAAVGRLRARADERGLPRPPVTVGGHLVLGEGPAAREAYDTLVRQLVEEHGVPEAGAAGGPMAARPPEELAELYTAYAEAGADRVIGGADNLGWEEQLDFVAEARALLPG